jgi:hypothetical protein
MSSRRALVKISNQPIALAASTFRSTGQDKTQASPEVQRTDIQHDVLVYLLFQWSKHRSDPISFSELEHEYTEVKSFLDSNAYDESVADHEAT